MLSSLKFDATPPDFQEAVIARVQASLKPGEYLDEDVLSVSAKVAGEILAQAAQYQKYTVSSSSNPYIAESEALNKAASYVGIQERYTPQKAYANIKVFRDTAFPPQVLAAGSQLSLSGQNFISDEELPADKDQVRATAVEEGFLNIYPTEAVLQDGGISFLQNAEVLFFADGRNAESDSEFRIRVLQAFRNPTYYPNEAGLNAQFKQDFPDLRNISVQRSTQIVYIYPLFQQSSFPPYGIPNQATLDEMRKAYENFNTIGLDAAQVLAPQAVALDISIVGLTPDTQEMRKKLTQRIQTYFETIQRPGQEYKGWDLIRFLGNEQESSINDVFPSGIITPDTIQKFFVLGKITFQNVV